MGDSIFIQSGGKRSVINYMRGAVSNPLTDPDTEKTKGVIISVPFREHATHELNAFGVDEEREVMNLLAQNIPQTIIKLSEFNRRKNLVKVIVKSVRLDRVISWKQTTKKIVTAPKGYRLMERSSPPTYE